MDNKDQHGSIEVSEQNPPKESPQGNALREMLSVQGPKAALERLAGRPVSIDTDQVAHSIVTGGEEGQALREEFLQRLSVPENNNGSRYNADVSQDESEESSSESFSKLSVVDRSIKVWRALQNPQTSANVFAAGLGVGSFFATDNPYIGLAALTVGLATAGADRARGWKGKMKGAAAGLLAAGAIKAGIEHAPGPQQVLDKAALFADDFPNVLKVTGLAATQIAARGRK